jgi:sugar O-acyltransferase (sialic acid O-acetyltransferase NeuD family)
MTMMQKKPSLVIIGAGGHASDIFNVATVLDYRVHAFIHDTKAGETHMDCPVLGSIQDLKRPENYAFAIAIGDNYTRKRYIEDIMLEYPDLNFPTLIHPKSDIGTLSQIGKGTIVMPYSIIGANTQIADFVVFNNRSFIAHDSKVNNYASLSPSVTTGGSVIIGEGTSICISATIREKTCIGDYTVIGGMSFVDKDIPSGVVAYGIPAKVIRERTPESTYLR